MGRSLFQHNVVMLRLMGFMAYFSNPVIRLTFDSLVDKLVATPLYS